MGKKDIGEKRLEDYADVFADIVNVLAFHGERLLNEEDIVSGPTESAYEDEAGGVRCQLKLHFSQKKSEKNSLPTFGLQQIISAQLERGKRRNSERICGPLSM